MCHVSQPSCPALNSNDVQSRQGKGKEYPDLQNGTEELPG